TINETTTSTEYTPGTTRTTSVPMWHAETASCKIGVLTPQIESSTPRTPGPPNPLEKIMPPSQNIHIPDGVRMIGEYDGPGGASIAFGGYKAIVGCHATIAERPYEVSLKGGQILINLGAGANSQAFTLRPDGTLAGDGSTIMLVGKRKTGEDALGDPTYIGSSDTCTYGNLTPRGQAPRPGSTATGNGTPAPVASNPPSATSPAVKNAASANATSNAVQPAVLRIGNSFAGQAANPLSGKELIVLNQSWEDVLRSAGFQDP